MTEQKLGIVADDLTGSMDSSGYFACLGLSTVVVLDPSFPSDADVAFHLDGPHGAHASGTPARRSTHIIGHHLVNDD